MPSARIKGITIEIGGDTTKLTTALKNVDNALSKTQTALQDVNRLLKVDPGNWELLTQKQRDLKSAVSDTRDRLKQLKDISKQAREQLENGTMGQDQFDALQREIVATEQKLKSLTGQYREFGSASAQVVQQAGEKIQKVGNAITSAGKALLPTTAALTAAGGAAAKFAMDFQSSMAKVKTIMDPKLMGFEDMEKAILHLSSETGVAAGDVAEAVYSAISAGQETDKAVAFVEQSIMLAKAGFADTGQALNLLTTILNAYGLASSEAETVSNRLITTQNLGKTTVAELGASMGKVIPTANLYGVSLDNLASAYATTTKNGIATAESGTYINSMMNELGKSGSTAAKVLEKETKKSFLELMDGGSTLVDVLLILEQNAAKTGKSVADMFGSQEAGKAAATLLQHTDDFNNAMGEMRESAGATRTAFQIMSETLNEEFKIAANDAKNAAIELGGSLLNELAPVIQTVTAAIKNAAEWFNGLDEEQKQAIVTVGLVVAAAGPVITVLGGVVTAIGTVISVIGTAGAALAAVTGPVGLVVVAIAGLVAGAVAVYKNFDRLKTVFKSVGDALSALGTKIKNTWNALKSINWSGIGKNAGEGFTKGLENSGVTEKTSAVVGDVKNTFTGKSGFDTHSPSKWAEKVGEYVAVGLANGIEKESTEAEKAAEKMASNIYSGLSKWADRTVKFENLSLEEQIAMWEAIQERFERETDQWWSAREKLLDLQKSLADQREKEIQASYNRAVSAVEYAVKRFNLSTSAQVVHYEEIRSQFVKGSEQWLAADEKVFDARKKLLEEQADAWKAYYNAVHDANEKIAKLEETYQKELADRTKDIFNSYKLFDEVPEKQKVSGEQLLKNLDAQIYSIEDYYAKLLDLQDRGVSSSLVDALRDMGVSAADELDALLALSDEKLSRYSALYEEKQALANRLAEEELSELQAITDSQIQEQLDSIETLYRENARTLGEALPNGLAAGILSGKETAVAAAVEVAKAVEDAIREKTETHSPSRLFERIADEGWIEGLVGGVRKGVGRLHAALYETVDFPSMLDAASHAASASSGLAAGLSAPARPVPVSSGGGSAAAYSDSAAVRHRETSGADGGTAIPKNLVVHVDLGGRTIAREMLPLLQEEEQRRGRDYRVA